MRRPTNHGTATHYGALDVDEMWNIFKTKIDSGVTQFIPLTSIQDFTVLNGKGR